MWCAEQLPPLQIWTPMNKQHPPLRPHTFRTLEELERQAHKFAGNVVPPVLTEFAD